MKVWVSSVPSFKPTLNILHGMHMQRNVIKLCFKSSHGINYNRLSSAPYLAIFEQGGSADIFSLITGGGGGRDDTSKSVIVFLLDL